MRLFDLSLEFPVSVDVIVIFTDTFFIHLWLTVLVEVVRQFILDGRAVWLLFLLRGSVTHYRWMLLKGTCPSRCMTLEMITVWQTHAHSAAIVLQSLFQPFRQCLSEQYGLTHYLYKQCFILCCILQILWIHKNHEHKTEWNASLMHLFLKVI